MGKKGSTCQQDTQLVSSGVGLQIQECVLSTCGTQAASRLGWCGGRPEWGRGLNREEGLMEKGWPGSLVQVPHAKCLIWDSTPSQGFRRHPVAVEEIAG